MDTELLEIRNFDLELSSSPTGVISVQAEFDEEPLFYKGHLWSDGWDHSSTWIIPPQDLQCSTFIPHQDAFVPSVPPMFFPSFPEYPPYESMEPASECTLDQDLVRGDASESQATSPSEESEAAVDDSDGSQQAHIGKGGRYSCNRCQKSFGNRADLRRHEKEAHECRNGLRSQNKCPFKACKRSRNGFVRRYNLEGHVQRVHSTEMIRFPAEIGTEDINTAAGQAKTICGTNSLDNSSYTEPTLLLDKQTRSSDRIRQGIKSEILTLRAERQKISKRGSLIDEQLAKLNHALEGLDKGASAEVKEGYPPRGSIKPHGGCICTLTWQKDD